MNNKEKIKLLQDLEDVEKYAVPGKYLCVIKYPDGRMTANIKGREVELTEKDLKLYKVYNETIIFTHPGDDKL